MRTYYECPYQTGLVVPAGASKTFAIPYPNNVRLTMLRIVQTNTPTVNFTAALYNRLVPDTPSPNNADEAYNVLGVIQQLQSDASGVLLQGFADQNVFFVNRDDPQYVQRYGKNSPSLVDILYNRKIYVRITNSGAGSATFQLSLGSEQVSG